MSAVKNLLPAVALFALLTGCAVEPGPDVSLVTVSVTQATALETTTQFTLRLNNPKPEPVTFEGGVHKLYLNGTFCGEGLNNQTVTLDRLSSTTQVVTVHLSNLALATRIKAMIESRSFEYRIVSLFHGKSPAGRWRTTADGRLDLKDFQPTPATNASPGSVTNPAATP